MVGRLIFLLGWSVFRGALCLVGRLIAGVTADFFHGNCSYHDMGSEGEYRSLGCPRKLVNG